MDGESSEGWQVHKEYSLTIGERRQLPTALKLSTEQCKSIQCQLITSLSQSYITHVAPAFSCGYWKSVFIFFLLAIGYRLTLCMLWLSVHTCALTSTLCFMQLHNPKPSHYWYLGFNKPERTTKEGLENIGNLVTKFMVHIFVLCCVATAMNWLIENTSFTIHSFNHSFVHSGGARVFAARGKRLCCRPLGLAMGSSCHWC